MSSLRPRLTFFLTAYLPPLAWAVFIFFLSSQPQLPTLDSSTFDYLFKKSAHVFVYAVLYFLVTRATLLTWPQLTRLHPRHLYLPLILCFLYALSDEFHQSFVPGRTPTVNDLGFDMLGAGIVFLRRYGYV